MIAVIDYGCGNLAAFISAFKKLNISVIITNKKEDILFAKKIILPGVGAFDHVMKTFNKSGLKEVVQKQVLEKKIPLLGVCAGMQILANTSEEGIEKGLGWIKGEVKMFNISKINHSTKIPHMGWNSIKSLNNKLFIGLKEDPRFYFVHSYYFKTKFIENVISKTEYGESFASAINHQNIYGVQFHPEKSHENGLKLLSNFAEL